MKDYDHFCYFQEKSLNLILGVANAGPVLD